MGFGDGKCRVDDNDGVFLRRVSVHKNAGKTLFVCAFVLLALVFVFAAVNITLYYVDSAHNERKNQEYLEKYNEIVSSFAAPALVEAASVDDGSGEGSQPFQQISVDDSDRFAYFFDINPDFTAFLTIPGTSLALPVVQGEDNTFYLDHGFERQKLRAGTIFMDYMNGTLDNPDKNTVLYGHNMKDGSMFSVITKYRNEDFWSQAPVIVLYTPDGTLTWQVFAAYTAPSDMLYNQTSFESDLDYQIFLMTAKSHSIVKSDIEPDISDTILTLSTCAYDFKDARFTVHARLLAG